MISNHLTPNPKPSNVWTYLLKVLITVALMVAMGSCVGVAYLNWHSYSSLDLQRQAQQLKQTDWEKLDYAAAAAIEGDYLTCANVLSEVSSASSYYARVQQLLDTCYRSVGEKMLLEAEELAKLGEFKKAISAAILIEKGSVYATAQQRIKVWSRRIIDLATERYNQPTDEIEAALEMLRAIPRGSPLSDASQRLTDEWKQERSSNDYHVEAARQALKRLDLAHATESVQAISHHRAWESQRQQISLEIQSIENFFNSLVQAAEQHLRANQLTLAAETAYRLPDIAPWQQKKLEILEQVRAARANSSWLAVAFSVMITLFLKAFLKSLFTRR